MDHRWDDVPLVTTRAARNACVPVAWQLLGYDGGGYWALQSRLYDDMRAVVDDNDIVPVNAAGEELLEALRKERTP